jgi:hypothetical protein
MIFLNFIRYVTTTALRIRWLSGAETPIAVETLIRVCVCFFVARRCLIASALAQDCKSCAAYIFRTLHRPPLRISWPGREAESPEDDGLGNCQARRLVLKGKTPQAGIFPWPADEDLKTDGRCRLFKSLRR